MRPLQCICFIVLSCVAVVPAAAQTAFLFGINSAQEVPTNASVAKGVGIIVLNNAMTQMSLTVYHNVAGASAAHIHQQVAGVNGGIIFNIGVVTNPIVATINVSAAQVATLLAAGFYVNIHSGVFPGGEIRGQIVNAFAPQVFISEFCADPAGPMMTLDTNADGVASANDDEFVEIVNGTNAAVDLTGWHVRDSVGTRHVFQSGTIVPSGGAVVLFGGGSVATFNMPVGAGVVALSGSLALDDAGDTIELRNAMGAVIDSVAYVAAPDGASATANPSSPTAAFVPHPTLPGSLAHSAGRLNDGMTRWPASSLSPIIYPGNGSDAAISIAINGTPDNPANRVHTVVAGAAVTMLFSSPGSSLTLAPFLGVAQVFATGMLPPPILLPGDAFPTLYAAIGAPTVILADGLSAPGGLFAPVLGSYQVFGTIPLAFGGAGFSVMLNCLALDPGRNLVNLGVAQAHELVIP